VDRYKFTHWWLASQGTGTEGKREHMRCLAALLPFPTSLPLCDAAQAHRYFVSSIPEPLQYTFSMESSSKSVLTTQNNVK
jgi:hypothetical protein